MMITSQYFLQRVASDIIEHLRKWRPAYETVFDPIIEALYYIGYHNILQDDLELCDEHNLEDVSKQIIL